jgi:hypothetical protein
MQRRAALLRVLGRAALALALGATLLRCGQPALKIAPPWSYGGGGAGGGGAGPGGGFFDAGASPPPAPDASGLCGNQFYQIISDPPNVYFLFDVSGSMADDIGGSTKYSLVQEAAAKVVTSLGDFIKAGAAVFPLDATDASPCAVGGEIYPPTQGQAAKFIEATQFVVPNGGTPTAATLTSLLPHLTSLPGKTILVLATDGGPNCNPAAMCTISECGDNIDGCVPGETCCAEGQNCCSPTGQAGPLACVDEGPTVQAVAAVAAAGIPVYVIGVPGSSAYAEVLQAMATAGGTATPSPPGYYAITDLTTLSGTLLSIAAGSLSCDFTVSPVPTNMLDTAVYFGDTLVPYDAFMMNGWAWSGAATLTLYGSACAELRSGQVSQVQIVSGCPVDSGAM